MTPVTIQRHDDAVYLDMVDRPTTGGIRLRFDHARDGWVIEQPRVRIVDPSPDENDPEPGFITDWAETAFVRVGGRQWPGDLPWLDNPLDALSDSD